MAKPEWNEETRKKVEHLASLSGESGEACAAALEEIERQAREPQSLSGKIPDHWHEAKKAWPWLPETTEALDDAWRNRTRAENVIWLVEQAEQRIKELEALLWEWLHTPYFGTEGEWDEWVTEFRPRVQKALSSEGERE